MPSSSRSTWSESLIARSSSTTHTTCFPIKHLVLFFTVSFGGVLITVPGFCCRALIYRKASLTYVMMAANPGDSHEQRMEGRSRQRTLAIAFSFQGRRAFAGVSERAYGPWLLSHRRRPGFSERYRIGARVLRSGARQSNPAA